MYKKNSLFAGNAGAGRCMSFGRRCSVGQRENLYRCELLHTRILWSVYRSDAQRLEDSFPRRIFDGAVDVLFEHGQEAYARDHAGTKAF